MKKVLKRVKYFLRFLPDKCFIKIYYRIKMHRKINLKKPVTFNEKLNWLKLYDRNPLYTKLVDKYEVKQYIIDKIGSEYVIPTIDVWDNVEDINFKDLPKSFVLKCTHDSEGLVICKDKENIDVEFIKKKLKNALKYNFYYIGREWPYKNVKPRIIAEPYLEDHEKKELWDYKFFCFDGQPLIMYIATNRINNDTRFDFFDMDFNRLDIQQHYPNSNILFEKPKCWEKLIDLSRILSFGFKHIRVDFYVVDDKIYFGELTFFHMSGFSPWNPTKWDHILGDYLKL